MQALWGGGAPGRGMSESGSGGNLSAVQGEEGV